MNVLIILMLLANGQWAYHEVESKACERISAQVSRNLEAKDDIHAVWTTCVTRYKA